MKTGYIYGEPVIDIIRKRKSTRTYSKKQIDTDVKEKIIQYFQHLNGPFHVEVRFEFLDRLMVKEDEKIKLGTYGMIQGASYFIAAAVEKKEYNMEQLGYVFEDLILYITSLGIGTCWIAGTLNRSEFKKAVGLKDNEVVPVVTPLGYESTMRSPVDLFLKPVPGKKVRKPWNVLFFKDGFDLSLNKSDAGEYEVPLEMVRLAPSASNKQPWRVLKANGNYHFYVDHDPIYKKAYSYDIQKIDVGIAMYHFDAAARESGLEGRWDTQAAPMVKVPKGMEYIISWVAS